MLTPDSTYARTRPSFRQNSPRANSDTLTVCVNQATIIGISLPGVGRGAHSKNQSRDRPHSRQGGVQHPERSLGPIRALNKGGGRPHDRQRSREDPCRIQCLSPQKHRTAGLQARGRGAVSPGALVSFYSTRYFVRAFRARLSDALFFPCNSRYWTRPTLSALVRTTTLAVPSPLRTCEPA